MSLNLPDAWHDLIDNFSFPGKGGLLAMDADLGTAMSRLHGRLVYLATPYTKRAQDQQGRFCPLRSEFMASQASYWAAMCAANKVTAISPIVQAHAMINSQSHTIAPLDEKAWARWCAPLLSECEAVLVPPIEGMEESAGILSEVKQSLEANRPVYVLERLA